MAWLLGGLVLIAVYLLLVAGLTRLSIRSYRVPLYLNPAMLDLPGEDVQLTTSDGLRIEAWWVAPENPRAQVLLTHGYLMNRSEMLPIAFWLAKRGIASFLIDSRAHGRSQGKACAFGHWERREVIAAGEWMAKRAPELPRAALGSSMGAVAIALAANDRPDLFQAIVLDSAYGRLDRAISGWWHLWGGRWMGALLAPARFFGRQMLGFDPAKVNVTEALTTLSPKVAVLIVHGDQDVLASADSAQRNYDAVPGPKRLLWQRGYRHSEGRWEEPALYYREIEVFFDIHLSL